MSTRDEGLPAKGEEYNGWASTQTPTPARQAATVILLRGGARTLEVLLVKRTPAARFMGGAWVFPGGAVDTAADIRGIATQGRKFVPASVMVPPLLWLVSDESNSYSGESFVANLWDDGFPLKTRIEKARQSGIDLPSIV